MKKVLIIDALNMFFRCYARDPSISTQGNPAGGCVGFLKSMQKSMRLTQPDDVIVVWDGSGGSRKRREINKNYKMGRKVVHLPKDMSYNFDHEEEMSNKIWQQARLFEYLENLPICQFIFDEVEADDVISAITQSKSMTNWKMVILSNDRDFMQLCDNDTILCRPAKKPWEVLNTNRIIQETQVHPTNMALARAIVGDKSDNLPGVPGVGFGRVNKFFPFLAEQEEYSVQDLIKKTKELTETNKSQYLVRIIENQKVIQENYKIMQLYQPSISYQDRTRVDNTLAEREKQFNMTEFRLMLSEDGFISLRWDILEQTMRRIVDL
jgi:5'-3' exonuclease